MLWLMISEPKSHNLRYEVMYPFNVDAVIAAPGNDKLGNVALLRVIPGLNDER
jgi:hypothetical protein